MLLHLEFYCARLKARKSEKTNITRMLEDNIIKPSRTEQATSFVFVPKKNKSLRICIDFRKFSILTKQHSHSTLRIDEFISYFEEAAIFSQR